MIELTERQDEYLSAIADGHDTIQALADTLSTSAGTTSRRLSELRDMMLIDSKWVVMGGRQLYIHSLAARYHIIVRQGYTVKKFDRKPITDGNIFYAAILTNGGLTGQQRLAQFQKLYPDRTFGSLKNILRLAGRRRLIRR